MVISSLHGLGHMSLRDVKRSVQVFIEFRDLRWNRRFRFVLTHEHIRSFQTVAGNAQNRRLVRRYAALSIKLARSANGYAAGRLSENSLGLRQKLDGVD